MPDEGSDGTKLKAMDPSRVWLAPVLGAEAVPASSYKGDPAEAVWLPDERVARAWMEYVRTGAVGDTTPPPAPTGVRAAISRGGIEVTWGAEADLESGLRQFIIRRDGKDIDRVPRDPVGRFGRPLFQAMSYHDTPEEPLPTMRFVDTIEAEGRTPRYQVIAVNGVGLESEPSLAARAP